MEVSGKVKKIMETQTFGSGFQKKELVITTQEQYPQDIIIEFVQDKISLAESVQEGEDVKVSINLRGREWINPEGVAKYFNSLSGWRLEKISSDQASQSPTPPTPPAAENFSQDLSASDEEDDLPF